MAVRKEITVQHEFSQEEIAVAVRNTLLLLWGYEERSPGVFESDIGTTWASWGERFTVDITGEGTIRIVSEPKVSITLFDYGKNQENVKRFLNALKHTFSTSGLAESKPGAYTSFMSDKSTRIRSVSPDANFLAVFLMIFFIMVVMLILGVFVLLIVLVLAMFLGVLLSAA
jgi:hypothetical protein